MTYNGNTVNSNVVTGEIVQALTIDKTAVGTSYEPDEVVAYVVNIRNSGAAPITGLTLTDDLGTYSFTPTGGTAVQLTPLTYVADSMRYFQNGVEQTAPTVTAGANGFSVTGLNVPAGGVATLAYRARVNDFANTGAEGAVENTVTLTGGRPDRAGHGDRDGQRRAGCTAEHPQGAQPGTGERQRDADLYLRDREQGERRGRSRRKYHRQRHL